MTNDNADNRQLIENCVKRGKRVVNPIIDWTSEDVWEFIYLYRLPYNALYDQGYLRVGCVTEMDIEICMTCQISTKMIFAVILKRKRINK